MASVARRPDGRWRARYRDEEGKEHAKHTATKREALDWLDGERARMRAGTWVDPKRAKLTLGEWCEEWLRGYSSKRLSTVRQAQVHVRVIRDTLGSRPLKDLRPSEIKTWVAGLQQRYAPSTVYALHRRLGQIVADAVHDGIVPKSPVSRRTSPPTPKQRPYVATTAQVWALHDAMPEHMRNVVLLGAFAGLRVAEIAALRVSDVDFMRGIIMPAIQYPHEPLKTEMSRTPIPIPHELALELNRVPAAWGSDTLVVGAYGRAVSPYRIEQAFRAARESVPDLPDGFRIHDLRHYFASLLIAAGLDIKTVQARLRHASATTTLNVYGHMWPDRDESSRAAIAEVFAGRTEHAKSPAGANASGALAD